MKLNCWEYKRCGRQPGGRRCGELGVCPASMHENSHKTNSGMNAGRYCWRVAGTLCTGLKEGTFADKLGNCANCDFYNRVKEEEGDDFSP